jgi:hypothetical protein
VTVGFKAMPKRSVSTLSIMTPESTPRWQAHQEYRRRSMSLRSLFDWWHTPSLPRLVNPNARTARHSYASANSARGRRTPSLRIHHPPAAQTRLISPGSRDLRLIYLLPHLVTYWPNRVPSHVPTRDGRARSFACSMVTVHLQLPVLHRRCDSVLNIYSAMLASKGKFVVTRDHLGMLPALRWPGNIDRRSGRTRC